MQASIESKPPKEKKLTGYALSLAHVYTHSRFLRHQDKLRSEIKSIDQESKRLADVFKIQILAAGSSAEKLQQAVTDFETARDQLKITLAQKNHLLDKMHQEEKQKTLTAREAINQINLHIKKIPRPFFAKFFSTLLPEARIFLQMKQLLREGDYKKLQGFFTQYPLLVNTTFFFHEENKDAVQDRGITPLMFCMVLKHKNNADLIKLFCKELGADINAKSVTRGHTALHWAIREGNHLDVPHLLEAGASPIATDAKSRTPSEVAKAYRKSPELDEIFKQLDAAMSKNECRIC